MADWPALVREAQFRCEDLAALCFVSERQLERFFVAQFGHRPKEWIQHFRMQTALQLLRRGYSTKAAAFEVCYEGPCQFCREFKKYFGCSPQHFAPALSCRIPSMMSVLAQPSALPGNAAPQRLPPSH